MGSTVYVIGEMEVELNHRLREVAGIIGSSVCLWRSLTLAPKVGMLEGLVSPRLLFGSKTLGKGILGKLDEGKF